jgi:hypothetical protein
VKRKHASLVSCTITDDRVHGGLAGRCLAPFLR